MHCGVLCVTLLSVFACTFTVTFSNMNEFLDYPSKYSNTAFVAISISILALAVYFHVTTLEHRIFKGQTHRTSTGKALFKGQVPGWSYLLLLVLLLGQILIFTTQSRNIVDYHPTDALIRNARVEHQTYREQASASTSLEAAVRSYRARYSQHPPPGFDEWYRYATARNSVIIDDYDGIHRDLLPFYELSPAEVRRRSQILMENPWYNATGISIRGGKAAICTRVNDDHRWMVERLVDMISKFSAWLPDMNIAFNVDDQCRITGQCRQSDQVENVRDTGELIPRPDSAFSSNRAAQWELRQSHDQWDVSMKDYGWQPIFHSHGTLHCPPKSLARRERQWDRSELCIKCISPHSRGIFPANWTAMSDICHQPDLAEIHGFYTSPSAFRPSHELMPLFSQSKAPGFRDILYPSAWNWAGKAEYAPTDEHPDKPFMNKDDIIFWRGTASEGLSPDTGQWKAHSRQRLLHILNDINVEGLTQAILLPNSVVSSAESEEKRMPSVKQGLAYTEIPVTTLTSLVSTDVHFVRELQRCWDVDCPNQEAEFILRERTNFQAHWQHKYLLDLDGAGFSGRFLPFLLSRSLPFKAALFREWWDDRLTAWQHFVPVDLRGHGLWATLVYFTGLRGRGDLVVDGHVEMGEVIAENGRMWADEVLRKEDMEVYFFRLLLEWGRLTDNARGRIGYIVQK